MVQNRSKSFKCFSFFLSSHHSLLAMQYGSPEAVAFLGPRRSSGMSDGLLSAAASAVGDAAASAASVASAAASGLQGSGGQDGLESSHHGSFSGDTSSSGVTEADVAALQQYCSFSHECCATRVAVDIFLASSPGGTSPNIMGQYHGHQNTAHPPHSQHSQHSQHAQQQSYTAYAQGSTAQPAQQPHQANDSGAPVGALWAAADVGYGAEVHRDTATMGYLCSKTGGALRQISGWFLPMPGLDASLGEELPGVSM